MQTNYKQRFTNENNNGRKQSSKIKIEDIFSLKINALGPKKIGLVELNNGLTLLIPNTNLGDIVKVKLEKIFSIPSKNQKVKFIPKYALGSVVQVLKKTNMSTTTEVEIGKILDLTIKRKGPKNSGLVPISDNFTIIVPNTKVGDTVKVEITKIKPTYAFGKIVLTKNEKSKISSRSQSMIDANISFAEASKRRKKNEKTYKLTKNKTYNILIPSNAKSVANFFVFKLTRASEAFAQAKDGNLLFVKKSLGIQSGDSAKILIIRTREKFAIAKILKLNPISNFRKDLIVKNEIKKMVESGIHYGERAIRCNANMRSYIWLRKKGRNKNRPFLKRGRHVINLLKTRLCLKKAFIQLAKYAYLGQTFLFVGTKKPAASLIARTAVLSQTAFFVNSRWLGGMLTNWKTILKSISQIRPILKEKQKVIHNLLEKRQKIKERLFNKVNMLRKKSRKLMIKGKKLIQQLQKNPNYFIQKSQQLMKLKRLFLIQSKNLMENYSNIFIKQEKILNVTKLLKEKENKLMQQKIYLKNMMQNDKNTLISFKKLFLIGQELMKLKQQTNESGTVLWAVSYEKFNQILNVRSLRVGSAEASEGAKEQENSIQTNSIVPSPSAEILYKILSTMKIKLDPLEMSYNKISNKQMNKSKSASSDNKNTSNNLIISKLLDKFTLYLPFIKNYMNLLIQRLQNCNFIYEKFNQDLQQIREKLNEFSKLTNNIQKVTNNIQSQFLQQIFLFNKLNKKLRLLSSEQRLLKFLPKLRFLPTTKNKMYERVELLMKKFVDPRMNYPMDQIYDQKLRLTSKKIAATRKQKWQRLEKYFGGVTQMSKMSKAQISNNVAIIVGQQEEMNAVHECKKLGIKMFTIIDTNCNPKLSDHVIPANDDSRTSIQYILGQMLTYIRFAQKLRRKVALKKSLLFL
uniref:Small ribosomal subunit protein uS2c n=1 Tax=Pseudopediastrum boryanum TaxID=55410 RepID=A0A2U8GJW1_PSEBY|nr:ribosomal protein S2 [Pseudopediastrum boryanum]AWI68600.1 ribosomal protein S2 [Pseudopediastrum boryanum]